MSHEGPRAAGMEGYAGTTGVAGPVRPMGRPFTREQRTTIIYGILCFVTILVILQLWLFTATMNAFLGGDESVIWPAAAASLLCLALNAGLLRYLYRMERERR